MSLCFLEAVLKRKLSKPSITEEEILDSALAHLSGMRHQEDKWKTVDQTLRAEEPWLASFRNIALHTQYPPVQDTSQHKRLFTAILNGDLDDFKTTLDLLGNTSSPDPLIPAGNPSPNLIQPAACLAAQREQVEILSECLTFRDAKFDKHLNRAAQLGATSIPMMKLLLFKNWADIRTSPAAVQRQMAYFGPKSWQAMWLKDNALSIAEASVLVERRKRLGLGNTYADGSYTAEQIQSWHGDVDW